MSQEQLGDHTDEEETSDMEDFSDELLHNLDTGPECALQEAPGEDVEAERWAIARTQTMTARPIQAQLWRLPLKTLYLCRGFSVSSGWS